MMRFSPRPRRHAFEPTRGYFDHLDLADGHLSVRGWLIGGGGDDEVQLCLDGEEDAILTTRERPLRREDVRRALPAHLADSGVGFAFRVPIDRAGIDSLHELTVTAHAADGRTRGISTWFDAGLLLNPPELPPPPLMRRVAHTDNHVLFVVSGMQTFAAFWEQIAAHRDPTRIERMLDWGCGCGRVTWLYPEVGVAEVHGCDVDAEAIAWCQRHLRRGTFATNPFEPPTRYADRSFDLVTSYSVLTHLSVAAQHAWIREVHRVLRPGGLAVLSVHGEYAAGLSLGERARAQLTETGIHDAQRDATLDDVTDDADYYRATFQTEAWVREHWEPALRVVDYAPQAVMGYQDLVVLERPAGQDAGSPTRS